MAVYDDDDDFQNYGEKSSSPRRGARGPGPGGGGGRGRRGKGGSGDAEDEWSVEDDGPDDRDLVPDEMTTVRCGHCRKLIFEDLVRCPYCRQLQLEEHGNRKPLWFVVTVIFCLLATAGVGVLWVLRILPI